MRIGVFTFVLLASIGGPIAAQTGCPDLSGRYVVQGEDGQNVLTITQTGCSRITIASRSNYLDQSVTKSSRSLRLDGTWQRERGSGVTLARFNSDTLTLIARRATKDTAIASREDFVRLSNGDLCTRLSQRDLTWLSVAARFGASAASRESAAERSGPHQKMVKDVWQKVPLTC